MTNQTDNVYPLRPRGQQIPRAFHPQLLGDLKVLVTNAYDFGFEAGEHVGKALAEKERAPAMQSALGIGVVTGFCIGVVSAVVVLGMLS